jgi:citrate synthase
MAYRIRQGRHFNVPVPGLSYTETFLYLLDHLGEEDYKPHPVVSKALDVLFILHGQYFESYARQVLNADSDIADHELNCSTATMLQVGSSLADPYAAVAASCAALSGSLHGGVRVPKAEVRAMSR